MIFKHKDSLDRHLQELEQALHDAAPGLERQRLEKDLAITRAGLNGEQEAAYHIDFHLRETANWAVIHDFRIEWNGRVAQMDHLLISRLLEIYVVESKSFRSKVRYANGGWERLNFNHWEGIPSPVEQNERHIAVLRQLIAEKRLSPTRLGIRMAPSFHNIVVVQPSCSIVGNYPEDVRIYRLDTLVKKVRTEDPTTMAMLKVVSADTLHGFAADLLACHTPLPVGQPRLSEPKVPMVADPEDPAPEKCHGCAGALSKAEARYCRSRSARFASALLCRKCQNLAPRDLKNQPLSPVTETPIAAFAARCAACGAGVEAKVIAFCRFNSKRFGGRILCRLCQAHLK